MISYGRQSLDKKDIAAVIDVLQSDYLTQGPKARQFSKSIAQYCGAAYASACSNASMALIIACRALGLGDGDLLWTSPISFSASANCALHLSADVDFVDIDGQTGNISYRALSDKFTEAYRKGRLPKVLVCVHYAGYSCDMKAIRSLAIKYGVLVIEDASHAIGGQYREKPIGNLDYADIVVFSFHPVKIITSAEGGMLLCDDKRMHDVIECLINQGIESNQNSIDDPTRAPWFYQQTQLGFNARMSDVHAALGLSQFSRIDSFVSHRRALANIYSQKLKALPIVLPLQESLSSSSCHLYTIRTTALNGHSCEKIRLYLYRSLLSSGFKAQVHYIPIHTHPIYQQLGFHWGDFPEAESFYHSVLSLPLYVGLDSKAQQAVINCLRQSFIDLSNDRCVVND